MSHLAIEQYHKYIENLRAYGGSTNETAIRSAFLNLLQQYCDPKHLLIVPEISIKTEKGMVRPDGTIKDFLRLDRGYWESKDSKDDLDTEIEMPDNVPKVKQVEISCVLQELNTILCSN